MHRFALVIGLAATGLATASQAAVLLDDAMASEDAVGAEDVVISEPEDIPGRTTISTLPDQNSTVYPWGRPDTSAYGQTITFDRASTLNSFKFLINDEGSAIGYDAYVFAWNGFTTVGSALFTTSGVTDGWGMMTGYVTDVGGLALGAGQYALFLQATTPGEANWASVEGTDAYKGGDFIYQNNDGDVSMFDDEWNVTFHTARDLAFKVDYTPSAVPVPAALPLLGAALAGLGLVRRRSRRA